MNFDFAHITNIDQILPLIEGNASFDVKVKDWYTVINYNYYNGDPFKNYSLLTTDEERETQKLLHECRGIKFCSSTGNLLARPFHKFFNVNEKHDTLQENIDWSQSFTVMEKVDGSMIHPCHDPDGNIVFMTKAGVTDVAQMAFKWATKNAQNIMDLCKVCCAWNVTPIFEYTGPYNHIVVKYPVENMTLLAIRDNVSGKYWDYTSLVNVTASWNVDVVKIHSFENISEFLLDMGTLRDIEGFVIRFEDGHKVKVKCDWYLELHKAKENLTSDRKVLRMVLSENWDDLKASFVGNDKTLLEKYYNEQGTAFNRFCIDNSNRTFFMMLDWPNMTPKEFNLEHKDKIHQVFHSLIYRALKREIKLTQELYIEHAISLLEKQQFVDMLIKSNIIKPWTEYYLSPIVNE